MDMQSSCLELSLCHMSGDAAWIVLGVFID